VAIGGENGGANRESKQKRLGKRGVERDKEKFQWGGLKLDNTGRGSWLGGKGKGRRLGRCAIEKPTQKTIRSGERSTMQDQGRLRVKKPGGKREKRHSKTKSKAGRLRRGRRWLRKKKLNVNQLHCSKGE